MTVASIEAACGTPGLRSGLRVRAARSWLALLGPAFAVSVGYMDPGNWATDLAAGAYGYRLLWAIVLANAIAVVLQVAVSRITIAHGESLSTLIARRWPRLRTAFWIVFQGAAVATDLAEFSGIVLGIQMLFGWGILPSIGAGFVAVAALLTATSRRPKALEYALIAVVAGIGLAFVYQLPLVNPVLANVMHGAIVPSVPDAAAAVIVVGIIGATVMPHNLFLHSSLILENCRGCSPGERTRRGAFFTKETLVALNVAAFINGSILVVGAALHGADGSIGKAFASLAPVAGGTAAVMFGAALLLSGLAASTTATVSGDYIFAAFAPFTVPAVVRRAVTLVPAAVALAVGVSATNLLIWSQVALALVLPVVLIPLVAILMRTPTTGRRWPARGLAAAAVAVSVACIGFDGVLVVQTFR